MVTEQLEAVPSFPARIWKMYKPYKRQIELPMYVQFPQANLQFIHYSSPPPLIGNKAGENAWAEKGLSATQLPTLEARQTPASHSKRMVAHPV